MADLIAPPTSSAPLTAEDAAIIRAEKQLDEDTRGRLVQVYGESKTALGKRITLTRPNRQAWKCPACKALSMDIRRVCGRCLALEPGPGSRNRQGGGVVALGAGVSSDPGTQVRTIATTKRSYRQFTDDVTSGAAKKGSAGGGNYDSASPAYDDDEPDCDDASGSCRADAACTVDEDDEPSCEAGALPQASTENKEKHLPPERRTPFTHFISLPIGKLPDAAESANTLLSSLVEYINNTDSAGRSEGAGGGRHSAAALTPELVSAAAKLHMTLLLLSLPTPGDVAFAKELLDIFAERWAKTGRASLPQSSAAEKGVTLRFQGLQVMPERSGGGGRGQGARKTNPKQAGVVYMGLRDEASERAVRAVQNLLHECFAELIAEENRAEVEQTKVNLHMTIMNKKWRKGGAKRPFDATGVLETFGNATIGGTAASGDGSPAAIRVPVVELTRMSGADPNAEAYIVEASVPL